MSQWLNADFFTAIVIFYLINAVPSAMFGIALARRGGRPGWHGLLPGFFLPWIGLLFLTGQPSGTPHATGPARYSMIMLFVAGVMVLISIFLPWISGDAMAAGQPGQVEYAPNQVVPVAIIVWVLALGLLLSSIGLLFGGAFPVAIATGVLVAGLGGLLVSVTWLYGPAGLFLSEARSTGQEFTADVGPGGWVALVALVTAYVAVLVVPFGLSVRPLPAPRADTPLPPGLPHQSPPPRQPPGSVGQRPGATW